MSEEKKRFPWWLVACAVVLVLLAAVLGFIETVGRQGTLLGRYEHIKERMSRDEARRILGTPSYSNYFSDHWEDDHNSVALDFQRNQISSRGIFRAGPMISPRVWDKYDARWHVRRWAEQACTAIHGPRR
jgi:hypothetical protein